MGDFTGWLFVALTILGFGYALMWQIRDTLAIKRTVKWETQADKKRLAGHYLMAVSFAGFFGSYLLNVSVGMLMLVKPETVQHALINSNTTGLACFLFLAIFFISKFWVVPKKEKSIPLLKARI